MRIKLSDCEVNPKKIEAIENYCKKNNKLLALRDMKDRILAVGLSIKALQTSKSKEGFNHYNVIYKDTPVCKVATDKYMNEAKIEQLKEKNFIESYPIYDVYICVYEGIVDAESKIEQYWYNCYTYYRKNEDRFSINDLINRSVHGNRNKKAVQYK